MSEMSNQEWELVQRVKMYRKKSLEVLIEGGSFHELAQVTEMGMHLRIAMIEEKIKEILKRDTSNEEKAQAIAEELIEV